MIRTFGLFQKGDTFEYARLSKQNKAYVEVIALDHAQKEWTIHRIPKQCITSIKKGEQHET